MRDTKKSPEPSLKKKPSTVSKGNYYKRRSKEYYEKLGYTVELTEFVCGRMIGKGKFIYQKRDILASDGIAYNDKEFILWNSKHAETWSLYKTNESKYIKEYEQIKVPPFIRKQLTVWIPRKEPIIIDL